MADSTSTQQAADAIKYRRCMQKAALEDKDPSVCEHLNPRGAGRVKKKKGGVVRAKVKKAVKARAKAKKANRVKASSDHKFSY